MTGFDRMKHVSAEDYGYMRLAAAVVRRAASEYVNALISIERLELIEQHSALTPKEKERLRKARIAVYQDEQFFRSPRFDIFMPNTSSEAFIEALRERAKNKKPLDEREEA